MSIGQKVLKSSAFMLAVKGIQRMLGIVSTLILARLLTPADFGIVAIATLVVQFSNVLSNTGARQYIVRADTIDDSIVNTAWSLDIILKSVAMMAVISFLPVADIIWNNDNVTLAIAILAPVIVFRSLQNPQLHVDIRNLHYTNLFYVEVLQKVCSFLVVVSLAFYTRSFWALIVGNYVGVIATIVFSYIFCKYKPGLSVSNIKEQWDFSKWMLTRGFIGYLRAQIDTILVSKFFPIDQFGKFSIAKELSVMPANDVITPAVAPLLASFSQVKKDKERLSGQVGIALLVITIFIAPFCALLYVFSDQVILLLLGKKWVDASGMVQAMTPLLFAYSIGAITNHLLIAQGKIRQLFWYDLVSLFLIASVLLSSTSLVLTNFIWLRSTIGLILAVGILLWSMKLIGIAYRSSVLLISLPLCAAIVTITPVAMNIEPDALTIVPVSLLYFSVYIICIYALIRLLKNQEGPWMFLDRMFLASLKLGLLYFRKLKT